MRKVVLASVFILITGSIFSEELNARIISLGDASISILAINDAALESSGKVTAEEQLAQLKAQYEKLLKDIKALEDRKEKIEEQKSKIDGSIVEIQKQIDVTEASINESTTDDQGASKKVDKELRFLKINLKIAEEKEKFYEIKKKLTNSQKQHSDLEIVLAGMLKNEAALTYEIAKVRKYQKDDPNFKKKIERLYGKLHRIEKNRFDYEKQVQESADGIKSQTRSLLKQKKVIASLARDKRPKIKLFDLKKRMAFMQVKQLAKAQDIALIVAEKDKVQAELNKVNDQLTKLNQ